MRLLRLAHECSESITLQPVDGQRRLAEKEESGAGITKTENRKTKAKTRRFGRYPQGCIKCVMNGPYNKITTLTYCIEIIKYWEKMFIVQQNNT